MVALPNMNQPEDGDSQPDPMNLNDHMKDLNNHIVQALTAVGIFTEESPYTVYVTTIFQAHRVLLGLSTPQAWKGPKENRLRFREVLADSAEQFAQKLRSA